MTTSDTRPKPRTRKPAATAPRKPAAAPTGLFPAADSPKPAEPLKPTGPISGAEAQMICVSVARERVALGVSPFDGMKPDTLGWTAAELVTAKWHVNRDPIPLNGGEIPANTVLLETARHPARTIAAPVRFSDFEPKLVGERVNLKTVGGRSISDYPVDRLSEFYRTGLT